MLKMISFTFMACLTLVMLWAIGFSWFAVSVATMKPNDLRTDAVIVLTGGDNRIRTGLDLLLNDRGKKLFISGVNKQTNMADLIIMKPKVALKALCCIGLGYSAENTRQNAVETADWIQKNNITSILLVTSAYHMHRAKLEFHRHVKNISIISYPVITANETWRTEKFWRLTFEEYNKTILVWLNLGRNLSDAT